MHTGQYLVQLSSTIDDTQRMKSTCRKQLQGRNMAKLATNFFFIVLVRPKENKEPIPNGKPIETMLLWGAYLNYWDRELFCKTRHPNQGYTMMRNLLIKPTNQSIMLCETRATNRRELLINLSTLPILIPY